MSRTARMGTMIAAASLALGLSTTSVAFADDPYPSPSPEQLTAINEASAFLTEHGVDEVTQDNLFATYLAGGRWDSFSSASAPISVDKSIEDGYDKTVSYYPDGSVAVSRIERPSDPNAQDGLSAKSEPNGCTVGGSGERTNCNVDMWVGLVTMAFKANYNLSSNTVSNVWGASWGIGGACDTSLDYLGRSSSNTGNLTVSAQMCGVPYATSFNLMVTVSGGVATETWW